MREVLPPSVGNGPYLAQRPGATPGTVIEHEYLVTGVYRPGGFHEAKAREARFVRTLGERPAPPPAPDASAQMRGVRRSVA